MSSDGPGDYSDEEQQFADEEDIDQLRDKQRVAIQEMNFEYASELRRRIAELSEKQGDDCMRIFQTDLQRACEECGHDYTVKRKKILAEFHKSEIQVRRSATDDFVEKQHVHKQQIKELEDALFAQFKDRMNKPVPQFDEMTQRARQAALRGEFKNAQELRDDARDVQKAELEKRREIFETNYKIQVNGLLDRQRRELAELTDTMNKGVESVDKQRKTAIQQEVQAFKRGLAREYQIMINKVKVKKYDPRRKESQENETGVSAETRPIILKQMSTTFDEILKKFGIAKMADEPKPLPISRAANRSPSAGSSAASSVFRAKP